MDVSRRSLGNFFNQPPALSAGFSLIEVLVTLFITSVGLLSLAALQIQGLRCTHSAILRTHAVTHTTAMVEQLHAACTADPCAITTVNTTSIGEWQARILASLPQGTGAVSFDAASATVQVGWDDHGEARRFSVSVAL